MALTRPKYSQIYDTDWKQSVRLATTTDVGNLFLANVQPTTVDSVNVNVNDRILVKDQTNARQNGIYIVRSVGTGSNGWWTRTLDAAQSSFVTSGLSAVVSEGATNNGREYRLTTPDPITLDTTELSFTLIAAQPAGANTYVQFNDMNVMNGSPGFTFNKTSNTVNITGNVIASVGSFGNIVNGNIISSGAGQFSGQFNESITTAGVFVGNASSLGTPTPRIGFFNGNTTQNWQIDNSFGDFRWFVPGAVKLNLNPTGNLTVYGSILPSANVAYDLGSPTQKFRSAYFSGNTVYIGGESMSVAADGTWSFTSQGANINMGATAAFDPPSANISGNLTVGGAIIAGGSSGTAGYALRSTGTGIQWAAPSAGSVIDSGTSNVSILGSGSDIITTIGGTIVTKATSAGLNILTSTASAGTGSGALTVTGGVGIAGNLYVGGNLFIAGNLTTYNANNLTIDDSIIYLAASNPADSVDIGLVGHFINPGYQHTGFVRDATDGIWKLFSNVVPEPTTTVDFTYAKYDTILIGNIYASGTVGTSGQYLSQTGAGLSWVSLSANKINQDASNVTVNTSYVNVAINSSDVLSIGAGGVNYISGGIYAGGSLGISGQYLQSTGTGLQWSTLNANKINQNASNVTVDTSYVNVAVNGSNVASFGSTNFIVGNILPTANNVSNIGSSSSKFRIIHAQATQAQYADLAEIYTSDQQYPAGTVVVFGGEQEVTQSRASHDSRIAGVVSTNPAYLMNSTETGVPVALQGRVPCRVLGPISKGDRVVSSHIAGVAQRLDPTQYQPGCIIGKALQAIDSTDISIIEIVVGRV